MPYIHHNKQTDKYSLYSNLKAVSINEDINYHTLSSHFSRNKNRDYEKYGIKIIKVEMVRTYRAPNKK